MSTKRIACIINPRSHRVKRHGSILGEVCDARPGLHRIRIEHFDTLPKQISALADEGVRRIYIEGGDGTVVAVLSACLDPKSGFAKPPEIAILPGGSTNLAFDILGQQKANARAVLAQVDAPQGTPAAGTPVTQVALKVSSQALPQPQIGFLLSTGSLARAMAYVQRELHGPGRRGAGAVAAAITRFIAAPRSYRDNDGLPVVRSTAFRLEADHLSIDAPHCLSVLTTFPRLTLGLNPFWGTGDGKIRFTHLGWPVEGLRMSLLHILKGRSLERLTKRGFQSFTFDMCDITHSDTLMLDGELLPLSDDGHLHVSVTEPMVFIR